MKPIENWENVKPIGGESVQLPAGGYVCKIVGAKTVENSKHRDMLEIAVDITAGDFANFFREKYNQQTDKSKWPNAAIFRINLPDKDKDTKEDYNRKAGRFKKFIQDVEESNMPYIFHWDESTLKNKFVGCLFGREEFETQDGKRAWSTKLFYTASLPTIQTGNFKVPADRPMKDNIHGVVYYETTEAPNAFVEIEQDDSLPF